MKTFVGNPFNVIQYWLLHKLIAKEVNITPGDIVFSITIPHIYDRHENTIREQIERFNRLNQVDPVINKKITVDIGDNSFYDFKWEDIKIDGYDEFGGEKLKKYDFEVAI